MMMAVGGGDSLRSYLLQVLNAQPRWQTHSKAEMTSVPVSAWRNCRPELMLILMNDVKELI